MRKSYRVHVGLNGVYNGDSEFMAGESIMFSGPANKIPAGYLIEDGSAVGRVAYATLFAAIGTTYGAGDGATTFNLPDSRAQVWRGLDMGRAVDAGRVLGSSQIDALQGHLFGNAAGVPLGVIEIGSGLQVGGLGVIAARSGAVAVGAISNATDGTPRLAKETRVRNIAKIPLIKY